MISLDTAKAEWDAFLDGQATLIERLRTLTAAPRRMTETGPAVCESVTEAIGELLAFQAKGCPTSWPCNEYGQFDASFEDYLDGLSEGRKDAFYTWEGRGSEIAYVAELLGLTELEVMPVVLLYEARPDLVPRPPAVPAPVGMN